MKTEQVLEILKVVAWIIFIGLCIKTGALLISFLVSLFINSAGAGNLYLGINLSELYAFSTGHYIALVGLVIFLSGLKAWLFFHVVKIISKINIAHPFSEYTAGLISKMSGIALQIGITAFITNAYAKWLMKSQVQFSYEGGETEFLFLAAILFVIAAIFKRGIELQSENELTI
ncbi:MAG: DUF2975 domain-containing protein [Bacteroidales bacterium]|nr:DUF2975 domain-containing protein [Bacteroidales bacterium]